LSPSGRTNTSATALLRRSSVRWRRPPVCAWWRGPHHSSSRLALSLFLIPVRSVLGDDPPDATTRIGHVGRASSDDVDVRVSDGLAGRDSIVEADVEAVGLETRKQSIANFGDHVPDGALLRDLQFINATYVLPRCHERMPLTHRIRICKRDGMLVLDPDS